MLHAYLSCEKAIKKDRQSGATVFSKQIEIGKQEGFLAFVQGLSDLLTVREDDHLGSAFGEGGDVLGRGGRDAAGEIVKGNVEERGEADGNGEGDIALAAFIAAVLVGVHEEFFGHVFSAVREREDSHDFSSRPGTLRNGLTHLLYHLLDRRDDFASLFSGDSGGVFLKYFREQLAKAFDGMQELFPESVPKAYAETFYVSSFAELVSRWVAEGFQESTETMVGCYFALIRVG